MKFDWDSIIIDKHFIFKFISQEQIFERYLGLSIDDSVFYINPLRNDKDPDCKYFYDRNGRLWFVDFAERSVDCFNVVERIYRVNYWNACKIIAKDFGLIDYVGENIRPKVIVDQNIKKSKQNVVLLKKIKKYYSEETLAFWKKYKLRLTRDELINELYVHGIFPLDNAWIQYPPTEEFPSGQTKMVYAYNKHKPAYCYYLDSGDNFQFYFPYNDKKSVKFLQNRNDLLHFYDNLPLTGKYVVITKSRKDAFLLRMFGVLAIAKISERGIVSPEIMNDLQNRFEQIFTLFDRDSTGIKATIRMRKEYGTTPLLIPSDIGKKDFSDALEEVGVDYIAELIEETKTYYGL